VITGASEGIGRAYSEELARRGINVFLISRSEQKLRTLGERLENEYNIKTTIFPIDLLKDGTEENEIFKTMISNIKALKENIMILVNNVGVNYDHPELFHEMSVKADEEIINLNILRSLQLTKNIIPQMIERKEGYIVNLSSITALTPFPLLSVYAASKAFIHSFSMSLNYEYKQYGIYSQSVTPSFVVC
jgi:17beta-estradiol 17-dehydrogenase / very-long-chain 3-oxoacyl-CoA reductase